MVKTLFTWLGVAVVLALSIACFVLMSGGAAMDATMRPRAIHQLPR